MDFRDSNGTAAGNMARAGNSFWSNLMGLRQQNAQLPGIKANSQKAQTEADTEQLEAPSLVQQQQDIANQGSQKTKAGQFGIDDMMNRNYLRGAVSDPSKSDVSDQFPATPALAPTGDPLTNPVGFSPAGGVPTPSPADPSIPFSQQAPEVQQARISKIIAQKPPGSVPLAPSEVAAAMYGEEYARKNAAIPPLNAASLMSGGLQPVSADINGVKFAQPGATPILDANGQRTGQMMVNGEVKADPSFVAPKEVTGAQDSLAEIEQSQEQLQNAKDAFAKHPNITGPGVLTGGSKIGQLSRDIQGNTTGNKDYTAQVQLKKFLSTEVPGLLSEVHMGRITELEYGKLTSALPSMSDPKEVWNNYFKLRDDILQKKHDAVSSQLNQNGTKLPLVGTNRASQIVAPGSHRVGDSETPGSTGNEGGGTATPVTVKTAAEAKAALAKGQKFLYKGQLYGK